VIDPSPQTRLARELAHELAMALAQSGPLGLRQACTLALVRTRGLDETGALAVLEDDAELAGILAGPTGEKALTTLAAHLAGLALARSCLGCATCCRVSSPTLYAEDLICLGPGGLAKGQLFTLRTGELVHSARLGRVMALPAELIKLREASAGGGCAFLSGSRCAVYARRPLQCRHLECWSDCHAGQLGDRQRLTRADIYAGAPATLQIMAEYEARLPADRLNDLLAWAGRGEPQASQEALALMELDHCLRAGVSGRYGYPAEELNLLLGRPSWELARSHGLALSLDEAGRPTLDPVRTRRAYT
jgi:Fe-S-cluster containining protein